MADPDAKRYATALGNALRHMPIRAAQKTVDYAALVFVAFSMETPRVVLSMQLASAKANAPRPSAQMFQFNPPPPNAPRTPQAEPQQQQTMADGPPDYGNAG